jgi:hypothetical protein
MDDMDEMDKKWTKWTLGLVTCASSSGGQPDGRNGQDLQKSFKTSGFMLTCIYSVV